MTPAQADIYRAIIRCMERGEPATLERIRGDRNKSSAHALVGRLIEQGVVERLPPPAGERTGHGTLRVVKARPIAWVSHVATPS